MRVFVGNRQTGKTTELVKLAAERGGYIVCHSEAEAHRVFREAFDQNILIAHPITHDEFLDRRYGPGVREFYIDNVDILLRHLSRVPVHAISITRDGAEWLGQEESDG